MSPGTKVFLAVFGLLVGALVLYYATLGDPAPDPMTVRNPQRSIEDPLQASSTPWTGRKTITNPAARSPATPPAKRQTSPLAASVSDAARAAAGESTPPITDSPSTGEPTLHALTNTTTVGKTQPLGEQPVAEPPPETVPYVVEPGETMSSIARDWFGSATKWHLIAEANPYVDPTRMREGTTIQLPARKPAAADRRASPPPPAPSKTTYVVKSGDSLSTIAEQLLGSAARWREIHDVNRALIGPDPDDLDLGMTLVIPPG